MTKRRTTKFVVRGQLPFPLDMLRYDSCWPETSVDTDTIATSLHPLRPRGTVYLITLISANEIVVLHGPTVPRWNSFQWRVVEINNRVVEVYPKP